MVWDSGYKATKFYSSVIGTIQFLDNDIVELISSNVKIGSSGFTQKDKGIIGVCFLSDSERDIYDILKNNGWANKKSPKGLTSGDTIWVIPNKSVRKENPNIVGVKFKLLEIMDI